MKKFVLLYLLLLLILFGLFYWQISPMAEYINYYQTKMTLYFLKIGLRDGQLLGIDIWIHPHYKIIITKACNGMIPILILLAGVFAYPVNWIDKFIWGLIGYLILTVSNILRLLMVAYFVKSQADFPLYHDLFGNIFLIIMGLLLFYFFIRRNCFTV